MAMDGDKAILPEDIIINILKRLPVKSLIRFQSVCKDWKNLLNTPSFIADHLHHSDHKNPFLLLQRFRFASDPLHLCLLDNEMEVLEVQNTPMINSLSLPRVFGSCNGLLCVGNDRSPHSLLLWNPAIRKVREVPRTIYDLSSSCILGFGFSPIVNDYKIVGIYFFNYFDKNFDMALSKITRVEVYSLCTGLWKELEFGNIQDVSVRSRAFTANVAMFWLGSKIGVRDKFIISFDIATEVFTLIPMPMPASASKSLQNNLTVFEDKLALFSHFAIGNFESFFIDLWVMEEGTSASGENWSWTKKYTIGPFSGVLSPLSIWRNEIVVRVEEQLGLSGESVNTVLSLLNPTTNELKKFHTVGYGCFYDVFNYAESLVAVGNIDMDT